MDFSDRMPYSIPSLFSPDGQLLATAHETKLFIRDVESLDVVKAYKNSGTPSKIEWSKDSKFVMCAIYKRGTVQVVHSLEDNKWSCKISEGVAGISGAMWAPSCRHLLIVQEFQLKLTIWSLCEKRRWVIQNPKYSDKGIRFSHDAKYLAVLERRNFKDYIGIYYTQTWEMVKGFQVAGAVDLEDIAWSPDDSAIAMWDTNLEFNIMIYTPDGKQLVKYKAYEGYLGIKTVRWSKTGRFLAVGSFDQKLRLINNLTWSKISEHVHETPITAPHPSLKLLRQQQQHPPEIKGPTKYIIAKPPTEVLEMRPDPSSALLPKLGVGLLDWSVNDKFILTRNDNMPHTLWVWNMRLLSLNSIIKHNGSIRCAKWDPLRQRLMLCTGRDKLYMWSQEGCSIINVPLDNFKIRSFAWSPSGNCLMLMDKKYFCCCYINDPDLGEENDDRSDILADQKSETEKQIDENTTMPRRIISDPAPSKAEVKMSEQDQ
eukprot:jgi/Bigna1/49573/estExt_Genewise1.C_510121